MTRVSSQSLDVIVDAARTFNGRAVQDLRAPQPGFFRPSRRMGDLVNPGTAIGTLEILGAQYVLLAPRVRGLMMNYVETSGAGSLDPRGVSYGEIIGALDLSSTVAGGSAAETDPTEKAAEAGLVFRAPMSGRFYTRSSPDKPAFVEVGTELKAGCTVCLLEVMKTFNRVTYGGAGLPGSAKVTAILVADGADVTAGDPLLSLA